MVTPAAKSSPPIGRVRAAPALSTPGSAAIALQRAVVEGAPRLRRLRALAGERHVEGQQVAGANAGVDAGQRVEAPQQQSGAHEQHQGDGDLEGDERVAGPAGAAPLRSSTAGLAEIGVDAADRRVKRRQQAAQHAGAERQQHGEEQHPAVERHRLDARADRRG